MHECFRGAYSALLYVDNLQQQALHWPKLILCLLSFLVRIGFLICRWNLSGKWRAFILYSWNSCWSIEIKPGVVRGGIQNKLPFPDVSASQFLANAGINYCFYWQPQKMSFCSGAKKTWTSLYATWIQTWILPFLLHPFISFIQLDWKPSSMLP